MAPRADSLQESVFIGNRQRGHGTILTIFTIAWFDGGLFYSK